MATGTLYTYKDNFRAYKILIASQYSGTKITVSPNFKLGETNKSKDFLEKFPLGKVPAFETSDGTCIFESNAIAKYVSNGQLKGNNEKDCALIQQFVSFADNEILPSAATWVFPTYGIMQYNKQATEKAIEEIKKCLGYLNGHLLTRTFLVGERITLADITVACNLLMLYKQVLEPEFRSPYGNVNRWFTTLINQPEFRNIIGSIALCKKMAKFDAAKYAELNPKKQKESKSKENKPVKQKKETPKKEKKVEEEEDDHLVPKEPKKNPFADLPQTNFDFDAFKREYSNKDIATVAIPYFWQHFDKENCSIWFCEYKYPEELKRIFMACNLVSGMLQRIDGLRKIGFASMIIFGEDYNISISGVWLFKGQKLGFDLSEDFQVDSPSYEFRKLNPDNEDDRKLFNDYLLGEGEFGGKVVNQDKVFK
ncbi:elongation factor 1-gamma-A-like [Xenia sp. Carnegie-2017]|uniref:elongation factor 1-gamma-A-like n=1 Tax=Xenia sp. Carnegie-2017 TaxID=2897299 RepID=UPI001F043468|nr:elongation factor 1-gamma-A-like [Xenia sp. Carnegie-2017]